MQRFAPPYYKKFKCIADLCRHSCCVGWEIDVDEDARQRYGELTGEIGDRVRAAVVEDGEGAHFALQSSGRCALLDDRGLCRLISAVGEGYLCHICREHPRFYNEVGDRTECGIGACCEEAARLILSEENYADIRPVDDGDKSKSAETVWDFDTIVHRSAVYDLLRDTSLSYEIRLQRIAGEYGILATDSTKRALPDAWEYLYEEHRALLGDFAAVPYPPEELATVCERFLAYLIYRHASAAQNEAAFRLSVGVALLLEQVFRSLLHKGLAPVEAARILSEELEYSEDNIEEIRWRLELQAMTEA